MKSNITIVFTILCMFFLLYSLRIYTHPLFVSKNTLFNKEKAAQGRLVWQKYNCQACHQLYGLGGYLGPDLTNILASPAKNDNYIRAMLKSGTKQMPIYSIPENELQVLLEFFKSTNASGKSDPRIFKTNSYGMIEEK